MIANYILSLCASIACLGLASGAKAADPARPNVLMICVDDMNDWVGFLDGHPQAKTPNMDQLAAKGVNFTRAYCTSPGCSPSRNALLFGVEPHHSGLYPFYNINHIEPSVLDDYTALPLLFRKNGYRTMGISKVFHNPDNSYRQDELWDDYQMLTGDGPESLWIKDKGYHPDPFNKRTIACPSSAPLEKFGDYQAAMRAVNFLEQDQSKPFFLAVGFIKPHTPFIMPEENWDRFKEPIQPPPIKADDLTDIPIAGQSNAQIYVEMPLRKDDAWEDVRRGYLACINFTDDNVGRVLSALEQSRYADNTIVVLWSDHGFHLGEKRTFSKFSLWEEATRTPFIIWDPRRKGNGQACAAPVGLINVYQTLCDLVELKAPDYVDGLSLRPWLDDPQLPKESPAMTTWGRGNYTLRTTDWRYTRYFDGSEELYRETDDPNEWTNLANNPKYFALKNELASKWLPKQEAPQVTTGIELYNVADADSPNKAIRYFQNNVEKYEASRLQPSLRTSARAKEPIRLFSAQGEHYFRIPSLAVTTKDTLLAFAAERKGSKMDFGHDTDVVLRRSMDGGVTWVEPETILSAEGIDFHLGPVVVDRQTGSIFTFARSHGAMTEPGSDWRDNYILRSDDDGKTWTKSLLTLKNERASFRFGPGNGGHGIQLADGSLVIHGGYWRESDGTKRMSLCLIESRDHGKSWHVMEGSDLDSAHVEFCIAETVPGRIYFNIRQKYTPSRLFTFIEPRKSSISEAKQVIGLPSVQCRAGMVKVQGEDTAHLYLTMPTKGGRQDLALFRSNLEGSHWERVSLLHQGKASYSDLTVLPDGNLACLYEAGKSWWAEEILFLRIPRETILPRLHR